MAYQNPFADMMKQFSEFKAPNFSAVPSVDVNQLLASGRRNAEACTAAGQAVVESAQAAVRRQAELARAHVEKTLKTAKEMLVNGSPEINTGKQVEFAKSCFESNLNNLREIGELATKSCFEAFDILNRRASESLEELTHSIGSTGSKKKNAA